VTALIFCNHPSFVNVEPIFCLHFQSFAHEMNISQKNIAREYQRQVEKLDLLAQELQIEEYEKDLEFKMTEEKELQEYIKTIEATPPTLWQPKIRTRKWFSRCVTFFSGRPSKTTQQIVDAKSKMKKQLPHIVKAQRKLADTIKGICNLETLISAAKNKFQIAKLAYHSRWSEEEEECCKAKSNKLSNVLHQLKRSEQEAHVIREELESTKKLLSGYVQEKTKLFDHLKSVELEIQVAKQEIQAQQTGFETIRKQLDRAGREILRFLFQAEGQEDCEVGGQQSSKKTAPTTEARPTPGFHPVEDIAYIMDMISSLVKQVETNEISVVKAWRNTKSELQTSKRLLEQSKDKIEQMKPLYEVGLDTRHRKYELDMKDIKDSRPDWSLVHRGNEAAHNGRALADATMFQDFCKAGRPYPGEFEDQYNGVPAKTVWEHKDFTIFHEILSWHMDMRQFGPAFKKSRFDTEFQLLFSKIYPSFEVASNVDVENDPKLSGAYRHMSLDHFDANQQFKARRRERRDS
jgi:hypothetical protein